MNKTTNTPAGEVDSKLEIENSLKRAIKDLAGLEIEPVVNVQQDLGKGDFSTNAAMIAFARVKGEGESGKKFNSPADLAETIIKKLQQSEVSSEFDKIETAAPGFINFWLSNDEIISQMKTIFEFDKTKKRISKELILEFGDPNPFKEPHIGHLRNLTLGESLARLFEFSGVKVIRANYQGDVGLHVAKALYGLLQNQKSHLRQGSGGQAKISAKGGSASGGKNQKLDGRTLEDKVSLLAEAYAAGTKAYDEDESAKKEIMSINKKIYSAIASAEANRQNDPEIYSLWQKGRDWSLDYFEILYEKLGIKYKSYYFESQTAPLGQVITEKNFPKVFEKNDGAIIFRGEKYGLHTRVFITSERHATYEAKDLALAILKDENYPKASSIIMTANEQVEYFKVLLKALEMVDKRIADKTKHISYGFINLKEGKMSSRTGNVISAFWLLEEVQKRIKKDFKEVPVEVLEHLAVGAVKWSMLRFSRESNISFSIEESIDLAGNSGPYMQYTFARIQSLLGKGKNTDFEANPVKNLDPQLLALGRLICQFEIHAKMAADKFSPNILTDYLFKLAQNFNAYYEKEKIIGTEKELEKLFVTKAVGKVIKKGLYLLGISSPEKI
ncbi:MAG: arginine--tRNA ligase [Candidatus Levybacteria bacterium]|nr:arginine--tRNA ligase [Candidatus Levybacteria bacterium]